MQGMKRFDARQSIAAVLREAGLYRGEVDHEMMLPVCRFVLLCNLICNFLLHIYTLPDV